MSLKYKLLWVDDNKDEFDDEILMVKKYIEDLFFEPIIHFCESVEEAEKMISGNKYDVIFSDYNIDESMGDDFIESVRNSNVNTEILFYTGQSADLPKKQFDRVTFFKATQPARWPELLVQKMKDVISLSIEKLQGLTSIRGLVMAEVSDLDVKMTEIIEKYCKASEENEKDLRKYIIQKIEDRTKESIEATDCEKKCIHVWKNKDLLEVVHEQGFESYTKARSLDYIFKKIKFGINPFLNNYNAEIIQNRNFLAHCHSEIKDDKEILITNKGEKQFTNEEFKTIRSNILKYSKMFDEVLKKDF